MDITAHDNCKVSLFDEANLDEAPSEKQAEVGWAKWGTIAGWVSVLVAIAGIVIAIGLDKN